MATAAKVGMNLTGAQMSPKDTESLLEIIESVPPDIPGDATGIEKKRIEHIKEADSIGSVPVAGSAKGMRKTALDKLRGKNPALMIDKLGERLAYERNGVRLYQAMLAKAKALDSEGEMADVLQHICDEEYEHMMLVAQAMETLGADPTAVTPGADATAVEAMGVLQVLTDPRTSLDQCLNALLTVELADNAAWELLIEIAGAHGYGNIAGSFVKAKTQEDDHVVKIKRLMRRDMIAQAQ